ncbi:hypothetical protein ABK046_46685, partial [Streptomyces caeruleatus]
MPKKLIIFSVLFYSLMVPCSNASERILVALEGGGVVQLDAKAGNIINVFDTGKDAFGVVY